MKHNHTSWLCKYISEYSNCDNNLILSYSNVSTHASEHTWNQTHTSVKCTHSNTHHRAVLRSSSPAWRAQSCCGGSCWGCWSSHPSLLHCLPPEDMCFYPASSAQMRNDAPYCSAWWQRKKEISSHPTGSESHSSYNLALEEFVEIFFFVFIETGNWLLIDILASSRQC